MVLVYTFFFNVIIVSGIFFENIILQLLIDDN